MQSQQKKVKWSRGETADALEERTDTGITQVSVSKMSNIIADVYGNISRRPAFKMVPYADGVNDNSTIVASNRAKLVPFKIKKDDLVLFVFPDSISPTQWFSYYRVKNGRIVYVGNRRFDEIPITTPTGYAQYNNFMILSCPNGNIKIQAINIEDEAISFSFEKFLYSGTWFSDGTEQYPVSSDTIPGFAINTNQVGYIQTMVTTNNGIENNMYSAVSTGLANNSTNMDALAEAIPAGSIVTFANMGGMMRVEGICAYTAGGNGSQGVLFPNYVFDGATRDTINPTGTYCVVDSDSAHMYHLDYQVYVNGKFITKKRVFAGGVVIRSRASSTGFLWYAYGHWVEYPAGNLVLYLYGEVLAPAVDKTGVDTTVTVLSGYEELNSENSIFRAVTFSNQRLYIGGLSSTLYSNTIDHGALVVGSQIAKYNDFKNNYGTANEAVTVDVSTKAQEQVFHVVDYNGLQILTDVAEYSYRDGVPVKQSDNGTLKDCMPLVFNNTMIYADRSKKYIRVAQYQLQTNVFGSTKINALTQEDLVHNPVSLSFYEEKDNTIGTFLFVINDITDKTFNAAELAVCNLLPENQEVIWTRWDSVSFPYSYTTTNEETTTVLYAWKNQANNIITYTDTSNPLHSSQLYKADGTAETQFYENTVDSNNNMNSISVVKDRIDITQTFYGWTTGGTNYYTLSATPAVDDLIYTKNAGGEFIPGEPEYPNYYKVWAVGTNQITVKPQMYYWKGDNVSFYNYYWSTTADPQVDDLVYGYHINPHPFFDVTGYDLFTVIARSGNTFTIQRVDVDTMETMTIVATRTPGPHDENATIANRNSTVDETSTLATYTEMILDRFGAGDIVDTGTSTVTHTGETSIINDSVSVDNKVYFLCGLDRTFRLAELDYRALLDFNAPVLNNKYKPSGLILEGATVQVYDGTEYKFDAVVGADGTLSVDTSGLEHAHAGFWINAELISHPIDVGGKTYTDHKRIGKCVAVVRDTEAGAFTVCDKTGYIDNDKKKVNFYGCTGMKDEVRYTIKNIQGAKFTIESLTMIIEYATLDS